MKFFLIKKNPIDTKISPYVQVVSIILSLAVISIAGLRRLSRPVIQERYLSMYTFTPASLQSFGEFSEKITTGLYIDSFQKFDMNRNEYIFTGLLWFEFTPGSISFNALEKFEFEAGTILNKSERFASLVNDKILVRYNIRVLLSALLNYSDFPFDGHRLHIVLENKFVGLDQILFYSEQSLFNINTVSKTYGWVERGCLVRTGYKQVLLDKYNSQKTFYYPVVVFSIDYQRDGVRFLLSILLPLLLLFFIVMFSFSTRGPISVSTCTVGVTAILGYRFVIENISPQVGYFMRSDYMFLLSLALCSCAFVIAVVDNFILPFSKFYKTILYFLIYQLLNILMIYYIL